MSSKGASVTGPYETMVPGEQLTFNKERLTIKLGFDAIGEIGILTKRNASLKVG